MRIYARIIMNYKKAQLSHFYDFLSGECFLKIMYIFTEV